MAQRSCARRALAAAALAAILGTAGAGTLTGRGMPYAAFDRLPLERLEVAGGALHVGFAPGDLELPRPRLLAWIEGSAEAVALYYGRFPVPEARVLIVPVAGGGVRSGKAYGYGGPAVKVMVGRHSTAEDLARDWVLVHELIHLAFPSQPRAHRWMEEGISTYVESVARLQAGALSPEHVWGGFARGMAHGLPREGDRGLDHTPTWGRTYWGGALFCLLADLEILRRTEGRTGLQEALRAVVGAGGSNAVEWPLRKALEIGDEATSETVLSELYGEMSAKPVPVDLPALWARLGVRIEGRRVVLDDGAPEAHLRHAIARPRPPDAGT